MSAWHVITDEIVPYLDNFDDVSWGLRFRKRGTATAIGEDVGYMTNTGHIIPVSPRFKIKFGYYVTTEYVSHELQRGTLCWLEQDEKQRK